MAQPAFEAARQLELSKIPLFFGDATKDHFTPETWLYRLEQAREIGAWNAANTAIYMNMSFREQAIKWRDGVKDMGVNTADWDQLRAAFLRFYAPGATIRSCVANLDLKQGACESVRDFGPRVARVIHDIKQLTPDYVYPDPLFAAPIAALEGYGALLAATRQEAHMTLVRIGEQRISDLMSIHIFVAGLKPYLRDKCVTRVFNTYYDAYTYATQLEHNMSDPKRSAHITAITEDDTEADPEIESEIAELELQINKLRAKPQQRRQKRPGSTGGFKAATGRTPARDFSTYTCRYCNNKGHIQSACRKRIAAGAALVDNTGKPMRSVNETQLAPPSQPPAQPLQCNPFDPTINSIFNQHLNMY
jgi:hypothetical protein